MASQSVDPAIYLRPVELLQNLIRFDTTNPPGNEAACIQYVNELLSAAGFETTLVGRVPERPNLVTRLKGRSDAPSLLLHGHVDVVTTENQTWQYPPFEGKVVNGYVWGRGALDMKGGLVMILSALLRAKAEGFVPEGDVILAILSDEEAGGDYGAKYLVENHPHLFEGVRYAIGELGGFTLYLGGRKFYLIQVAEKQICWMKATMHGSGGHGAIPVRGGAMAKLGWLLQRLDGCRLPVHITPVVQKTFETILSALPPSSPIHSAISQLFDPNRADQALDKLGEIQPFFEAMIRNTVNPTVLHGSEKINVVPSRVAVGAYPLGLYHP